MLRRLLTAMSIALSVGLGPGTTDKCCRAEFTSIGPIPYLSKEDSPFPVDGSTPNFFLEDFEDGELNTPGIFQPLLPITHATVIGPHVLTDSVDADDGLIDGHGNDGHSLAANSFLVFPVNPPTSWSQIRFGFDRTLLGFYPNAFGFVWTDGIAPNDVLIELFDDQWNQLAHDEFEELGDGSQSGGSSEDRFLGVVSSAPFAFVQITSMYSAAPYTFEIDHVQYGSVDVPEPSAIVIGLLSFAILFGALHRQIIARIANN
jgi:hypothetical protein